jgi:hypothetical protein
MSVEICTTVVSRRKRCKSEIVVKRGQRQIRLLTYVPCRDISVHDSSAREVVEATPDIVAVCQQHRCVKIAWIRVVDILEQRACHIKCPNESSSATFVTGSNVGSEPVTLTILAVLEHQHCRHVARYGHLQGVGIGCAMLQCRTFWKFDFSVGVTPRPDCLI